MKANGCLLLALAAACALCACKGGGSPGGTEDKPPAAAPQAPSPADTAALNSDLAAKMTFAGREEIAGLLARGASPDSTNAYGLPVLFTAARRGDAEIVALLVKAGASVNAGIATSYNTDGQGYSGTTDGTPLGYAAAAGKIPAMEALRNAGADVNGAGPGGTTPLMMAAEAGQPEAVEWLLNNGASAGREKTLEICARFVNSDKHAKIRKLLEGK